MKDNRTQLIFSATIYGHDGAMSEVVIDEAHTVYYRHRTCDSNPPRMSEVNMTRRDVDDMLWEIEGILIEQWDSSSPYGTGRMGEPEAWMVTLATNRGVKKWQGYGEFPAGWQEFRLLLEQHLERPFGW
ncbi:MAG: hypothetical protein ACOCSQ_04295 [Planctomycetota bacterium]